MKSYTDIEQSKKLDEILPVESADMRYSPLGDNLHPWIWTDTFLEKDAVPCWSLAALLDIIPDNIEIDGHRWGLSIRKNSISYLGSMTWDGQLNISVQGDNLIDACYEMINKLHELNLL